MKPLNAQPSSKAEREKKVLFGLIETYIDSGKPIGSNTLKDTGFDHLSSATIRNYFSKLESEGYLEQQHSSGGRIPSEKAFRLYAEEFYDHGIIETDALNRIEMLRTLETKEVALLIRKALEELSELTSAASFISSPKFDQDFITDIKVLPIDSKRILLALITDFGSIQTEILMIEKKISNLSSKRIEAYLNYRLTGQTTLEEITEEEISLANRFYNEAIVRFFVGYTYFTSEEVLRSGLSKLLQYPEFRDGSKLAESLALFENATSLRHILRDTTAHKELKFWIGNDLISFGAKSMNTVILTAPYFINKQAVGAFGILGPTRIHYRKVFGILRALGEALSFSLTANLYKYKLTYRQPDRGHFLLKDPGIPLIGYQSTQMIENKKGI